LTRRGVGQGLMCLQWGGNRGAGLFVGVRVAGSGRSGKRKKKARLTGAMKPFRKTERISRKRGGVRSGSLGVAGSVLDQADNFNKKENRGGRGGKRGGHREGSKVERATKIDPKMAPLGPKKIKGGN